MKRASFILLCFSQLLVVAAAQRLPELAVPQHYELKLALDFARNSFSGEETIAVRILKPTSQLVLNSAGITFHTATLEAAGRTQPAKVTFQPRRETATLELKEVLHPGAAIIRISYSGKFNGELRGLYLSNAGGRKYAVTQFEATDARRAFPCFDEPSYKATFQLTVIAEKQQVAISNARVVTDTPGPGEGKHTVQFGVTPKMSSYLVALAVGEFEFIEGEADGVPIRVWTTPGKKQHARFALQAAEQSVHFFDQYFGVEYPFEKLDLIGVSDFSAGAMENTAAIIFRDIDLLADLEHASVAQQKSVALTIAHEIAHQWFGDLVTMKWWDDIWLNEGFANCMQSKPIAAWKPEWNLSLDEIQDSNHALAVDSLADTHPIRQPAETPEQINELFDDIVYEKAAAVLQMVESYLGEDAFRAGVTSYLRKHAYGNAAAEDFWNTLAEVSKKPVDRIMATFVTQPGAPLVSLQAQCQGGETHVGLSQRRYSFDRKIFSSDTHEVWAIPACLKVGEQKQCELLDRDKKDSVFQGCAPWVFGNAEARGFYRTDYDAESVSKLSHANQDLSPAERIRFLDDEWASVRVDLHPIGDYLALAAGFTSGENRAVIEDLAAQLEFINTYLVVDADRDAYQHWTRSLFAPLANKFGWMPQAGEDHDRKHDDGTDDDRKLLRAEIFHVLGDAGGDRQVIAHALRAADAALKDWSAIDGTMASTIFTLAAQNGDVSLYDRILAAMRTASSSEQYYVLMRSLAQFRSQALLERTLQLALTPGIRAQDMSSLISGVLRNPDGMRTGWSFVTAHWDEIERKLGQFNSEGLVAATGSFCDAKLADDVQHFFTTHEVPAAERTLRQSVEMIRYCVDLKSQQSGPLAAWLRNNDQSTVVAGH